MITIHFNRAERTAQYSGGFDGFGGDFTATGDDARQEIARQLTDAGVPDDDAVMIDERGMRCWTVQSIHACARRYRPNAADLIAKQARIEADKAARIAAKQERKAA